jgi:hypothetical protein
MGGKRPASGKKQMPIGNAGGYPPLKSSISDIVDEKDKKALYN